MRDSQTEPKYESSEYPGQPWGIDDICADNFDAENEESLIDESDVHAIESLAVGESHTIHGGACGDTTFTRVS